MSHKYGAINMKADRIARFTYLVYLYYKGFKHNNKYYILILQLLVFKSRLFQTI